MRSVFGLVGVIVALWFTAQPLKASPHVEHVFLISIDGGKPAAIAQSEMPVLKGLAAEGACTWAAQTVFPSLTLPSHTSMLTGVAPEKHHVLWNKWSPRKGVVETPTVFSAASRAGLSTAMFVGKEKFRHLVQPGTVDEFGYDGPVTAKGLNPAEPGVKATKSGTIRAKAVAAAASRYIAEKKPNLCFIHFTDPDDAGHKYGWGSPQQLSAFAEVDAALAEVLQSIEMAGLNKASVVIVTADHGGHRKTHGSRRREDMTIPWIAWGQNVRENLVITDPISTFDTAATALWLLGLAQPQWFDGKPVTGAFLPAADQLPPRLPVFSTPPSQ